MVFSLHRHPCLLPSLRKCVLLDLDVELQPLTQAENLPTGTTQIYIQENKLQLTILCLIRILLQGISA
jgi:hypothetical protein